MSGFAIKILLFLSFFKSYVSARRFLLVCMNWYKYSQGMKFWLLLLQCLSDLLNLLIVRWIKSNVESISVLFIKFGLIECFNPYLKIFISSSVSFEEDKLSTVSVDVNGNKVFCVKLRNFFSWISTIDFTITMTFFLIKLETIYWSITLNMEHTLEWFFSTHFPVWNDRPFLS